MDSEKEREEGEREGERGDVGERCSERWGGNQPLVVFHAGIILQIHPFIHPRKCYSLKHLDLKEKYVSKRLKVSVKHTHRYMHMIHTLFHTAKLRATHTEINTETHIYSDIHTASYNIH